jgi:ribonuclease BN (tRNA processing enzyme)
VGAVEAGAVVRLTVVGCCGSFPGPDSPASCYLVEAQDAAGRTWRVLLDLGNGALGPLQRHVRPQDVDAVLLSHLHPDHCLDLCGLYVALRYHPDVVDAGGPQEQLAVYGPSRTLDRLVQGYDLDGEAPMAALLKVQEWQHAQPVTVGPFTVTPYRVEHPVEAYGLRLELDGTVLAYTGDTDSCPALLDLARDADLLLAEASFQEGRDRTRGIHLTGRRAGEAAAEAGARRLLLTHLPVWNDPEVVLAEAREVYSGPVSVAGSGQVHEVRARS